MAMAGPSSDRSGSPTPVPEEYTGNGYFDSANGTPNSVDIPWPRGGSRRSSFGQATDRILTMGGVNSIENFARSWTRAAAFPELTPSRQSMRSFGAHYQDDEAYPSAAFADDSEDGPLLSRTSTVSNTTARYGSTLRREPSLLPSERIGGNDSVGRDAARLFLRDQKAAESEQEGLLVKAVTKEDGGAEMVVVGQSTLPQTVFNSVNVLIGIGLLSLPLGIKYAGWVLGVLFLSFSAVVTRYTAQLLAKCLDKSADRTLSSYSDIAYIAFGPRIRIAIAALFTAELLATCVALVVLFADSLHDLLPSISTLAFKILAGIVITPLLFLPLRVLSFSSVIGIFATFTMVSIVLIDGLVKPDAPGSLRSPMYTPLFPDNWATVPLSLGLLMSPWGGHSVFPSIYRDMRHPHRYPRAIDYTYIFTYILDAGMAVIGFLMFGEGIRDEVTSNILACSSYPRALSVALVCCIAVIPLTKTPLNARPIVNTLEAVFGLSKRALGGVEDVVGTEPVTRGIARGVVKVGVIAVIILISIVAPGFDRVMAFMGSALCFSICVVLPLAFYMKLFKDEMSRREWWMDVALVFIGVVCAVVGTAWTFLPRDVAKD